MSRLIVFRLQSCLTALLSVFLISTISPSPAKRAVDILLTTGSMQHPRASHTASLLPDGAVLIAGGFAGSGSESRPYISTEIFDAASGVFRPDPDMAVARSGHAAVVLKDQRILPIGGWSGSSGVTNTAEIYDPTTRRFSRTGNMALSRGECTATLLQDGKVLVIGGVDHSENALSSAEIFDPRTNSFSSIVSMSVARSQHTATLLTDGTVLIIGGGSCDCLSKTVYRSAELYDPSAGKFVAVGGLSAARYKHAAVLLADGQVLVAGGSDARDWHGMLSSAELYDRVSRAFKSLPPMIAPRFKFPYAAVRLQTGDVFVAGGASSPEVFRATERTFASVTGGGFEGARYFASATLLRDGRVLVVGGYAEGKGALPSTARAWIYQP